MEAGKLNQPRYNTLELAIIYALWVAFFFYIASIGWVSEDAYISFRVIENFFQGHGLRWNPYERVQAYTHPLWLLLHIPIYAIWENLFVGSVVLSVLCSAFAILITVYAGHRSVPITVFFFFVPLFASKSFVDYTSSGLENPLSYLLFSLFCFIIFQRREHRFFWFFCTTITALALVNRLDSILLYAPVFVYLVIKQRPLRWGQIFAGLLPLIAWLSFSLFYYGFLFPNTKYAKLGTDMTLWQYLSQGIHYAKYLFIWDLTGAIYLMATILFLLPKRFYRWLKIPTGMDYLPAFMATGISLYSIYVMYIGGDYMAGRFWALPVFAAICLWFFVLPERIRPDIIFAFACLFCITYFAPQMLQELRRHCKSCIPLRGRVIDARFVFSANRIVVKKYPLKLRKEGNYPFVEGGKKMGEEKVEVKKVYYIGMSPYYAGNHIKYIDELGLADPLLARLPAADKQNFYIGHFRRDIPKGYRYAVKTGSVEHMHTSLANYYEKLRLIVSGDLLDRERLKTIVLFNLGYYDHLQQEYIASLAKKEENPPEPKK